MNCSGLCCLTRNCIANIGMAGTRILAGASTTFGLAHDPSWPISCRYHRLLPGCAWDVNLELRWRLVGVNKPVIRQSIRGQYFGKLPVSLNCVFDASLVPETCLEFSPLAVCDSGFDSAS